MTGTIFNVLRKVSPMKLNEEGQGFAVLLIGFAAVIGILLALVQLVASNPLAGLPLPGNPSPGIGPTFVQLNCSSVRQTDTDLFHQSLSISWGGSGVFTLRGAEDSAWPLPQQCFSADPNPTWVLFPVGQSGSVVAGECLNNGGIVVCNNGDGTITAEHIPPQPPLFSFTQYNYQICFEASASAWEKCFSNSFSISATSGSANQSMEASQIRIASRPMLEGDDIGEKIEALREKVVDDQEERMVEAFERLREEFIECLEFLIESFGDTELSEEVTDLLQEVKAGNLPSIDEVSALSVLLNGELAEAPLEVQVAFQVKSVPSLIDACQQLTGATVPNSFFDELRQAIEQLEEPRKTDMLQLLQEIEDVVNLRNLTIEQGTATLVVSIDRIITALEEIGEETNNEDYIEEAEELREEFEGCGDYQPSSDDDDD